MTVTAEPSSGQHAPGRQEDASARLTPAQRMAGAVKALALDSVGQQRRDEAGLSAVGSSFGMADVTTTLWTRFHKFDAADPQWPDRDRFVLSAGHGALLLYALIHLTGHDGMTIDDIRAFRQLHSPATGHPEYGQHPAVETTAGGFGQGLATAVGMALAERNMAARFGKSLVDHCTWVVASEADIMEGVGHEAASLAGHLGLSRLTVLYESNIASDGDAAAAQSEDVLKRFAAYGWAVKRVDAHDPVQVNAALSFAVRSKKPTLIACRTMTDALMTDALWQAGEDDATVSEVKASLHWHEPSFVIPDDLRQRWHAAGSRGATARRSWLKRLARHNQRGEFERAMGGRLPDTWHESVAVLKQELAEARPTQSTRASSERCLETLAPVMPELVGGTASPGGSAGLPVKGVVPISGGNHGGRYLYFGVREHGMAAAANGMAVHGGIVPYVVTRLAASDYLRPALRMSAMMGQRVIYALTHDSIGLGEDGPSHQPVEHLASLRAMPNVLVFRPADAVETAECWELAIRRSEGPSVLVLSRQELPPLRADWLENRCARGGYVLAEADGPRQATVIATGSEVPIAMAARERLAADGIAIAVVSLPCWELFARQDDGYRAQVLGGAPRVGIEAATGFGWEPWLGPDGLFIGMSGFGASAPYAELYSHFGITTEAVVAAVARRVGS